MTISLLPRDDVPMMSPARPSAVQVLAITDRGPVTIHRWLRCAAPETLYAAVSDETLTSNEGEDRGAFEARALELARARGHRRIVLAEDRETAELRARAYG